MRPHLLAPLAALALATTVSTPSMADEAAASASFSTSGAAASASGPSAGDGDAKKTVMPWIVGGLGVAQIATGVVLLVAAPDMPDNCNDTTRTCTRKPGQSATSFDEDQGQAGDAQQMNAFGVIGIASGAVFLAAGAAMYFWYHRDPGSSAASAKPVVVPYAGTNGGGLAAVATF